jgi:cytochrome c oxidase subunit IV
MVAGGLLLLTLGTIGASFLSLGPFHIPVALGFAVAKAILVAWFFMHVRFGGNITRLAIVVGIVWFGIMLVGTMDDYLTRSWLGVPGH